MSKPTSHSAGCHSNQLTFLLPVKSHLKRQMRLAVKSQIECKPQNRHVSEIAKSSIFVFFCSVQCQKKNSCQGKRKNGGLGGEGGFWVESGCIRHDNPTFANLQASQDSCIPQKSVWLSVLSVCRRAQAVCASQHCGRQPQRKHSLLAPGRLTCILLHVLTGN